MDAKLRGRRLFLLFWLGTERYALEAHDIAEILPLRPMKQVPATPDWVAGVFSHRGTAVPVIDLSRLATGVASASRATTRLVVVHYRHRQRNTAHLLGLLLERVVETQYFAAESFTSDGLDHVDARYLGPVARTPEGMLQWIRVTDLLPDAVHQRLFPDEMEPQA
ncbi:purine-binding chemotaxis protein CheW [Pigmentiphaga aceris]|uniref:Purine-binding chemotaxis protein CheW n=1 Tax=Pigmentiphaga aceris TaxID=1940612 RepID=A0A5C0B2F8_9BURK|nr:chemotaxis protein CheW [Pigmentiphaga aceris]QEI06787.1 purine-binding chemotaxis protein CheW [Pigmentiphaga aceris]